MKTQCRCQIPQIQLFFQRGFTVYFCDLWIFLMGTFNLVFVRLFYVLMPALILNDLVHQIFECNISRMSSIYILHMYIFGHLHFFNDLNTFSSNCIFLIHRSFIITKYLNIYWMNQIFSRQIARCSYWCTDIYWHWLLRNYKVRNWRNSQLSVRFTLTAGTPLSAADCSCQIKCCCFHFVPRIFVKFTILQDLS